MVYSVLKSDVAVKCFAKAPFCFIFHFDLGSFGSSFVPSFLQLDLPEIHTDDNYTYIQHFKIILIEVHHFEFSVLLLGTNGFLSIVKILQLGVDRLKTETDAKRKEKK